MKYRRRLEQIDALQYDGTNLAELVRAASEHHGTPVVLSEGVLLRKGSWLILQAQGGWQILPNVAFQRIYEPIPAEAVKPRTCFGCAHYALTGPTGGFCGYHEEPIESETLAAQDCPDYLPER